MNIDQRIRLDMAKLEALLRGERNISDWGVFQHLTGQTAQIFDFAWRAGNKERERSIKRKRK